MSDLRRVPADGAEQWVRDEHGQVFGTARDTLVDAETGRPRWLLVETGTVLGLGARLTAVPAERAQVDEQGVHVPFARPLVEGAPTFEPESFDEAALRDHYGVVTHAGPDALEVVRSEEEISVRTVAQPHERVRVRKEVVTEEVHVTVSVRREILHVERADLQPPDVLMAGQEAAPARELAEDELVIELFGEVPVIGKAVVPVERVRVRRDVVTENATVHGPRRVERVEVDRRPAGS